MRVFLDEVDYNLSPEEFEYYQDQAWAAQNAKPKPEPKPPGMKVDVKATTTMPRKKVETIRGRIGDTDKLRPADPGFYMKIPQGKRKPL